MPTAANAARGTRMLYLDDSGAISPKHSSGAVVIGGLDCTVYTASIDKTNMHHSMATKTSLPMQLHRLVEHFAVECAHRKEIGLVVIDGSENRLDAHASHCVASYVTSKDLPLHPVVHYVDSMTSEPTQAADLISAVRRRTIEGTPGMDVLNTQVASLRANGLTAKRTHTPTDPGPTRSSSSEQKFATAVASCLSSKRPDGSG